MPNYPGKGNAALLRENQQVMLWQNERIGAGAASLAFLIERRIGPHYPWGVSLELRFSGDPGTFQVDIQTSDTDQDEFYVTKDFINAGLNSSNIARYELTSFWAKYIRAKIVTLTNDVNITVQLTR